jgi:hypothetical protein
MKLTIIHLWMLACVAYGFVIFMALQRRLVASTLFTLTYLSLLISTWWVNQRETEDHVFQMHINVNNIVILMIPWKNRRRNT